MAKEDIDKWAAERLKTPDGRWINDESPIGGSDVMFCILYAMENRIPRYDFVQGLEYERLVEIACEYLSKNPNHKEILELKNRVIEDGNWDKRMKNDKMSSVFSRCLTTIRKLP